MNDIKVIQEYPKKVIIKKRKFASNDFIQNTGSSQLYPAINTNDYNSSKSMSILIVDDYSLNKGNFNKKQESTNTFSEMFKPINIKSINISKAKRIRDDSIILNYIVPRNPLYYPKIKALNEMKQSRNNNNVRYGSYYF